MKDKRQCLTPTGFLAADETKRNEKRKTNPHWPVHNAAVLLIAESLFERRVCSWFGKPLSLKHSLRESLRLKPVIIETNLM